MHHMRRRGCVLLCLLGTLAPAIAIAAGPSIHVRPSTVTAGRHVHIYGRAGGCPKGDRVTLLSRAFVHRHEFAGVPAVFTPVLSGDRYSVRVRIPRTRHPARYAVTARCGGGNFGVTAHLRVRSP